MGRYQSVVWRDLQENGLACRRQMGFYAGNVLILSTTINSKALSCLTKDRSYIYTIFNIIELHVVTIVAPQSFFPRRSLFILDLFPIFDEYHSKRRPMPTHNRQQTFVLRDSFPIRPFSSAILHHQHSLLTLHALIPMSR